MYLLSSLFFLIVQYIVKLVSIYQWMRGLDARFARFCIQVGFQKFVWNLITSWRNNFLKNMHWEEKLFSSKQFICMMLQVPVCLFIPFIIFCQFNFMHLSLFISYDMSSYKLYFWKLFFFMSNTQPQMTFCFIVTLFYPFCMWDNLEPPQLQSQPLTIWANPQGLEILFDLVQFLK